MTTFREKLARVTNIQKFAEDKRAQQAQRRAWFKREFKETTFCIAIGLAVGVGSMLLQSVFDKEAPTE